jgi:AsmA protein
MRKLLIAVIIAVVVIVLGLVLFVSLFNADKYRPQVQAELQKSLNRPVTIGQMGLKLFPFSIDLKNVVVGESPTYHATQPFAAAKNLYVSVGLFSLLRGDISVKSLRVEQPHVQLIRNPQGVWNFSTIGAQNQTNASSGNSQAQLTLDDLRITDGRLTVVDQTAGQLSGVYDHIDLDLNGYAPHKRFSTKLDVHLPGQGQQLVSLDAQVGPIPTGKAALIPVDGTLSLTEVSLSGIQKFLKTSIPPGTDTVASGKADLKTENGAYSCKGNLKLAGTKINNVALANDIQADFDVRADTAHDLIQIRSADLKLGPTPLSISGTYDSHVTPALVDLKLTTSNASITEIAKIAGALGIGFNPKYQIQGSITADLAAKGTTKQPALSGTLTAKNVEVSGSEIKQPVRVPELDLTLSPQTIQSKPFVAESGSTKLTADFALSQYTTPNSVIDASLKTEGANVAEVLSIAKAYGLNAAEGVNGSGSLSMDVHVQGPLSQTSRLVMAGSGKLTNAQLSVPSLAKPISIQNADLSFHQADAGLNNVIASLGSTTVRGNLSVSNFAAPQLKFAITADKINVDELQSLETKSTAAATPGTQGASKPRAASHSAQPGFLQTATGSGTLAAGSIVAKQVTLNNVHATCNLNHGLIMLSPLTSDLFSGKESGALSIDTRPAAPVVAVNAKLAGVDTNQLLSAMSSAKDTLYGALAADTNVNFRVEPSGNIAQSLNGDVSFKVTNGRIEHVNILNELSKIGKFMGAAGTANQSQPSTALKQFSGSMHITNGVAETNNLVAVLDQGSLAAKGSINLVTQALNLHTNAVLGQGYSQTVGGSHVGGYLNTALANKQGELVLPVIVTGTFAHPVFAPDVASLSQMKLKNLLPTTGDPAKLGSGLINSILGGKNAQPGQAPAQQTPANAVDSIFRALKKKK